MPEPTHKDALIAQLQAENQQQKAQIELLKQELKLQKEKIDALIRRIFGSKTEQLDPAQLELLLCQGAELGKAEASVALVPEASPTAKRPSRKASRGRERWPQDLPVEREYIDPEEVAAEPESFRCIGEEISEKLDYQPARFFRRQLIRRKYVSRFEPDLAPIVAPLPESLQERCIAAPGLLAQIIVAKYSQHLPLYAAPGIKRSMPGARLCRVERGSSSKWVVTHPA